MSWRIAFIRSLAGLTINLSSGWFGAIVIAPNFSPIKNLSDFLILIYDFIFGTIFLVLSVIIEKNQKI